jgi:GNAT superfamily N-acetyltransferase
MEQTIHYALREFHRNAAFPLWANDLLGDEAGAAWKDNAREVAIIAAMAGDEVGGAILLFVETDAPGNTQAPDERPAPKVASIRQLVIKPEHRGRGLAGRLLRRALAIAAEEACVRIRSTAGFGCPDHLAMYDRLRFTRSTPVDQPYLVTRSLTGTEG